MTGWAVTLAVLSLLVGAIPAAARTLGPKDCTMAQSGLVPLTDLGSGEYLGHQGGLFPDGRNEVPIEHLETGLQRAAEVRPRLADGTIDGKGAIAFISIGVSNTQIEFEAFIEDASVDTEVSNDLVLVNGAQFGRTLGLWASRKNDSTWERLRERLDQAGVTPEQVQVAWVMLPSGTRGPRTLEEARDEVPDLVRVVQEAKSNYPNLQLAYFSSREYGGYISDADAEPNAYLHGFEVKWLMEEQIRGAPELQPDPEAGRVLAPWLSWGPYLWADGINARRDGLTWVCEDFAPEGVHPAEGGREKVSEMLMDHFKTDPTSQGWFLADRNQTPTESGETPSTLEPAQSAASAPSRAGESSRAWWVVALAGALVGGMAIRSWSRTRSEKADYPQKR